MFSNSLMLNILHMLHGSWSLNVHGRRIHWQPFQLCITPAAENFSLRTNARESYLMNNIGQILGNLRELFDFVFFFDPTGYSHLVPKSKIEETVCGASVVREWEMESVLIL